MGFSYSCTAVDKIQTDRTRRAVPLRWLSFLLILVLFCYFSVKFLYRQIKLANSFEIQRKLNIFLLYLTRIRILSYF